MLSTLVPASDETRTRFAPNCRFGPTTSPEDTKPVPDNVVALASRR